MGVSEDFYVKDGVLPITGQYGYGTDIVIGNRGQHTALVIRVPGAHFNWFQKKMMKWCFGWDVKDYKDA